MVAFLVRRVGLAVLSLALISFLAFGMVHAVPGSAAVAVVGTGDPDAIAEIEVQLGLDRPLVEQYLSWAGNALRGDFGEALVSNRGQAVSDLLIDRLPATLALGIGGLLVSLVVGIPAGVMAALRPAGRLDRVVLALGSLWLAIPNFVFAIFAVRWLGAELGWFPVIGLPAMTDDPVGWLRALVLPQWRCKPTTPPAWHDGRRMRAQHRSLHHLSRAARCGTGWMRPPRLWSSAA